MRIDPIVCIPLFKKSRRNMTLFKMRFTGFSLMESRIKIQPRHFCRFFKGSIVQAQRARGLNHNGRRGLRAVLFTESASVAAVLVNKRHRGLVSASYNHIYRGIRAVFLTDHAALVFRPGKADCSVDDGGAYLCPSFFFQRQGNNGLCGTNNPAGRAIRPTRAGARIKKRRKHAGKPGLEPCGLQSSRGAGFHTCATAQAAVQKVRFGAAAGRSDQISRIFRWRLPQGVGIRQPRHCGPRGQRRAEGSP